MKITITHNGFHGYKTVSFFGRPTQPKSGDQNNPWDGVKSPVFFISVTRQVAKRLNKAVCGMSDCCCGEHVARIDYDNHGEGRIETGDIYYISDDGGKTGTQKGNYPQNI